MTHEEKIELLDDLDEYLANREDCDVDNFIHQPNREMQLRVKVIELKEELQREITVTNTNQ